MSLLKSGRSCEHEAWYRDARDLLMIKKGLESASPTLAVDPDQCQFQLYGRLTGLGGRRGLIDHILEGQTAFMPLPCFVPLWQTFESPASTLRQTFATNQKVNCLAANPDGTLIATGAQSSGVVQIWNLKTSRREDVIDVKGVRDILDVAWLHGSNAVVFGTTCPGAYACVRGQSAKKHRDPLFALKGHGDWVAKVAVSSTALHVPKCELIATGCHDKHLRIFNAADGAFIAQSNCHGGHITDLTWICRPGCEGRDSLGLLSASKDKTVVLSDATGAILHRFTGHGRDAIVNSVVSLAPKYPDHFASVGTDQKLIIWSLKSGKKEEERRLRNTVVSLEFIPDTCQLVLLPKTNQLHTFDLSASRMRTLAKRPHSGTMSCLAVAKRGEGTRVLTGSCDDQACKVWDAGAVRDGVVPNNHFEWKPVDSVAFVSPKPDSTEDTSPFRLELPNSKPPRARPRGITCSKLGFICSWDLDAAERLHVYPPPRQADEVAPQDSYGTSPRSPRVGADSKRRHSCGAGKGRDFILTSAAIPGSSEFVTGGHSGGLHVWSLDDVGHISHVEELGRHKGPVLKVGSIVHKRFFLASAAGTAAGEDQEGKKAQKNKSKNAQKDSRIRVNLWERGIENNSKEILSLKAKKCVFSVSDCGKYLLMGANGVLGISNVEEQTFRWQEKKKSKGKVTVEAVAGTERSLGVVRVVTAMQDRKLEVYDVCRQGRFEHRTTISIPANPGNFLPSNEALAFVPNTQGEWMVSGGKDQYLRLWRTSKQEERAMSMFKRSPRGSQDFSEGIFADLISESKEAEQRRGDSTVAVYVGAEVTSCRCFADGEKILVLVGRKDGTVTNVQLELPPAGFGMTEDCLSPPSSSEL